jgi:hypothetical protein
MRKHDCSINVIGGGGMEGYLFWWVQKKVHFGKDGWVHKKVVAVGKV